MNLDMLSAEAVRAIAEHFARPLAESAASKLGGAVVDWAKRKLVGEKEKTALQDLAKDPASPEARHALQTELGTALTHNEVWAGEVRALLFHQPTITQNVIGEKSTGIVAHKIDKLVIQGKD